VGGGMKSREGGLRGKVREGIKRGCGWGGRGNVKRANRAKVRGEM